MVKISIKKDKKAVKLKPKPKPKAKPKPKPKPPQKENQTQSQNVVVNVGSNGITAKRAPRQALQKGKVVNRQQTTPTQINVPQALPINNQPQQQSMNELIKYLKESETQKEIIKQKDQKINELEKDKKDKERSKILTEDEVQNVFSNVYNDSNISSLSTSGTATPLLSSPVNPNTLYDLLRREADLQGGNPNSGQITFATLRSNAPSSNSTLTTQSSDGIDQRFESTRETGPIANTTRNTIARMWLGTARQNIADRLATAHEQQEDLSTYIPQSMPNEPTETNMQSNYEGKIQDEIEAQQVVPVDEAPVIDEVVQEEPENQLTIYEQPEKQIVINEPQRTATTATATQQMIGIDDSNLPALTGRINASNPLIRMNDIFKENVKPLLPVQVRNTEAERQARLRAFDKPLAIKQQPEKETKAAAAAAEDTQTEPTAKGVEGYDDFVKYISNKNTYNWKLADILIKNGITDPKTGNGFYIRKIKGSDKQIAMIHGSNKTVDKTYLTELLRQKYNEGLIKNYLN